MIIFLPKISSISFHIYVNHHCRGGLVVRIPYFFHFFRPDKKAIARFRQRNFGFIPAEQARRRNIYRFSIFPRNFEIIGNAEQRNLLGHFV